MAGITVFTNAFLIDCTGKEPIDGATVVVEGEHIKDAWNISYLDSGEPAPRGGRTPDRGHDA